jgi:putative exosortase-affiliated protein, TIGR04073 family
MILNMASASYAESMGNKLNRGLTNILTGWFEVPNNISAASKNNLFSGLFIGLPKGCFMTVVRTAAGVYDAATFMFPVPKDYEPLLKPEFAFEKK